MPLDAYLKDTIKKKNYQGSSGLLLIHCYNYESWGVAFTKSKLKIWNRGKQLIGGIGCFGEAVFCWASGVTSTSVMLQAGEKMVLSSHLLSAGFSG